MILDNIPLNELLSFKDLDLSPYGIDAYSTTINPNRITIIWKGHEKKAIQIEIPTYEKKHPEKYVATLFGLFTVYEYTKQDTYTTTEINWEVLKFRFINACLELEKYDCKLQSTTIN